MITVESILTPKEILRYKEEWKTFENRYDLNSEYHTHSGKPVISQVFRFEDKPLFRAHVFDRQLRKIDPYFIAEKHLIPFWHISHYQTVLEQMYHASMREIKDTDKCFTKDIPQEFKLSKSISWSDNVSVELILKPKRQTDKYSIENCYFTLYDDKIDEVKGRVSVRNFVKHRAYIGSIERLKQGDNGALEELVRKIEKQDLNHKRLIKQRQNLQTTKDYLIDKLRIGTIPEEELHDFFSFWDKE
ncbi:MAG: hypothetical protein KAU20_04825 [Nanoarchaeota archaeon]|nr:hypothetical protein [Nanoarchaeota archaeon]